MALGTVTVVTRYKVSNKRVVVVNIQLSTGANWTAAGEPLTGVTHPQLGLKKIEEAEPQGLATNGTLTFQTTYDFTNGKLIASGQNASPGPAVGQPAVTGNTDLSGYTVRYKFSGF